MALTDLKVRAAKPGPAAYKIADSGGLYLMVTPAGSRLWRLKFRIAGREQVLSIGAYPAVSLSAARAARDAAKADLAAGRDPRVAVRPAPVPDDPARSFEALARAWHGIQSPGWSPTHAGDVIRSLERDVFPRLGVLQIDAIDEPMILEVLRPIEARGSIETARRLRQRISGVFVFAIGTGLVRRDPAHVVKAALRPLPRRARQAALVDLVEVRQMLARVEAEKAHPVTKLANRLMALTAARSGALRGTAWPEFEGLDGAAPVWRIPPERMKGRVDLKEEHVIPLAPAAVEVIAAVRQLTGRGPLVFPSVRSARLPMSENAIGYLLNRAGYHGRHTAHGWRSAFSTLMNERHPGDAQVRAILNVMLAHKTGDEVEAAYNRAEYMATRRRLAEEWAGLLLEGAPPALALLEGPRR